MSHRRRRRYQAKDEKTSRSWRAFPDSAGQFALLITEESVSVPEDALAFISIRATYKFQGLVNVSGFHVDPGFRGRLIFSVFNAGPSSVHLARGEDCFHIWFADLRDHKPMGEKVGYDVIPPALVKHIADGIQSLSGLDTKINDVEKKLADRLVSVEKKQSIMWWLGTLLLGVGITLTVSQFNRSPPAPPAVAVVANPASTTVNGPVATPTSSPTTPAASTATPQASTPQGKTP
ncbi:dCTP deaminase domain-containing protein [Rhizobium laguerreae]|uniref:dCTP deaminase domain-containing protein n=1 Tax=Rhizobium laguerreae TaxID=1076926 RepID=UPI003AAC9B51